MIERNNMSYETEQITSGPLTRCFYGYYSELFIQNSTKSTIVVIDCDNNKVNVPPISGNQIGREMIIIWTRKTTNPTLDHNNTAQTIPGTRINIPLHDLNREGGYYIEEINMVLCTEASSTTASHPKSSISFADAADQARSALIETLNGSPTIKLIANDPEGRYNKLYTTFGDMLVEIDVQHIYGEAELQMNYFHKGIQNSFVIKLDEFFEGDNDTLDVQDCPISFLTTNKAKALRYTSEYKKIPQSEVDELLKKASTKAAKDIAAVKDQYETDAKIKESEIKRLNDSIKNLSNDRDQMELKLKELTAALSAANTIREKEVKAQELSNKTQISDNNVNISSNDVRTSEAKRDSAETESKYKLWHIVAAASIPVAGALLLKVVSGSSKQIATQGLINTNIQKQLSCLL